jgi:hypothetical protein
VLLIALLLGCGSSPHHADQSAKPAPQHDAGGKAGAHETQSRDAATDMVVMQDASHANSGSRDAGTSVPAMDAGCAGVDCPQCDLGERPVMMAGQCCPVACEKIPNVDPGSDLDAGTCTAASLPSCTSNNWPYCAPDWSTAMGWYKGCPNPDIGAYLAQCGTLEAIIVPVMGGSRRYFYDAFGHLIGFESVLDGAGAHCEAYDASFAVPDAPCVPLDAPCPEVEQKPTMPIDLAAIGAAPFITWDGGTPDCATGQTAYLSYLASQLQQFNTCADSNMCLATTAVPGPANACETPCDVVFSPAAINSQIISRLNTFGFFVCAACQNGPGGECPFIPGPGQCVSGHCTR